MKVGYCSSNYLNKRNIIDKIPDARYVKVFDMFQVASYFPLFINRKVLNRPFLNSNDLSYRFEDFGLNNVDMIHFFNTIGFCKIPWITTFETIVPRFNITLSCHHGSDFGYSSLSQDQRILKALAALSGASCKKLIAMSECNQNIQKYFLSYFPEYQADIERKLTVIHPPQQKIVASYESKQLPLEGEINFLFVGSAFFRKGGAEILEVFQNLRKKNGYNIRLAIVSSLEINNYATKEKYKDVRAAKAIINSNPDWISYFGYLPNHEVIGLMKGAHVGLLPTYADSYGFSVLEFQAAGCPVVSTDVRALPEINNNKVGWVINIPKNRLGEALYTTKESRAEISEAIKTGLSQAIEEIIENRQIIPRKADAALSQIGDCHSPEAFSRKLGEIYNSALR